MARQFNLIPPVCEQAEYHFFQRDKVETQLPELYHKIGEANAVSPLLKPDIFKQIYPSVNLVCCCSVVVL